MKSIKVTEIMIPIDEYPTIGIFSTVYNAIFLFEKSRAIFRKNAKDPPRALFVLDKYKKLVGIVEQNDILQSLEPKYKDIFETEQYKVSLISDFSKNIFSEIINRYSLFNKPMEEILKVSARQNISEYMQKIRADHVVNIDNTFDQALNQMIIGRLLRLAVMDGNSIKGVLRRTDVYSLISKKILNTLI